MTIKDLIRIIREEELNYYSLYKIGQPHGDSLAETFAWGGAQSGICCDENRKWRRYEINERGGIEWWGKKDEGPKDFTEDEACQSLLSGMRYDKERRIKNKKRKINPNANILPTDEELDLL